MRLCPRSGEQPLARAQCVASAAATHNMGLPQAAQCPTLRQPERAAPSSPACSPNLNPGCTARAEAAQGEAAFSMQINLSFDAAPRAGAGAAQPASTLTANFAAVENLLFEGALACSGWQQQGLSPRLVPSPGPNSSRSPTLAWSPHAEEWLAMRSEEEHGAASAPDPAADSESLPSRVLEDGWEEPGSGPAPWSQGSSALAAVTTAAALVTVHAEARAGAAADDASLTLRCARTLDGPRQVPPAAPSQAPCAAQGQAAGGSAKTDAAVEPGAQASGGTTPLPRREAPPCALGPFARALDVAGAGAQVHADRIPRPCPAAGAVRAAQPRTVCAPGPVCVRANPLPGPAEPSHGPCLAAQPLQAATRLPTEHSDPNPGPSPAGPTSAAPRSPHAAASPLVREARALFEPHADGPPPGRPALRAPLSLAPMQRASPWQPTQQSALPTPETIAPNNPSVPAPMRRIGPWPPPTRAAGSTGDPQAGGTGACSSQGPPQQPPFVIPQRARVQDAITGHAPVPSPWPRQGDFSIKASHASGGEGAGGAAAAVSERAPGMKQPLALSALAGAKLVQPAAARVTFFLPFFFLETCSAKPQHVLRGKAA